jgi:hypothetical protein
MLHLIMYKLASTNTILLCGLQADFCAVLHSTVHLLVYAGQLALQMLNSVNDDHTRNISYAVQRQH